MTKNFLFSEFFDQFRTLSRQDIFFKCQNPFYKELFTQYLLEEVVPTPIDFFQDRHVVDETSHQWLMRQDNILMKAIEKGKQVAALYLIRNGISYNEHHLKAAKVRGQTRVAQELFLLLDPKVDRDLEGGTSEEKLASITSQALQKKDRSLLKKLHEIRVVFPLDLSLIDVGMMQFLVRHGVRFFTDKKPAFGILLEHGNIEVMKIFLSEPLYRMVIFKQRPYNPFIHAIKKGRVDFAKLLLFYKFPPPFIEAVKLEDLELFKVVVEMCPLGGFVAEKDEMKNSALDLALQSQNRCAFLRHFLKKWSGDLPKRFYESLGNATADELKEVYPILGQELRVHCWFYLPCSTRKILWENVSYRREVLMKRDVFLARDLIFWREEVEEFKKCLRYKSAIHYQNALRSLDPSIRIKNARDLLKRYRDFPEAEGKIKETEEILIGIERAYRKLFSENSLPTEQEGEKGVHFF